MKRKGMLAVRQEELFYLPPQGHGPQTGLLLMDDMGKSNKELEQLYQEAEEYDFLLDRTPKALPDYWQEED